VTKRPVDEEKFSDLPDLASLIDHTLLKPETTPDQVRRLCHEALEYGFASVCVNPFYVPLCAGLLAGSPVKVCTVVGFPLGANTSEVKAHEAQNAIAQGAGEIDMVINIGALKSGNLEVVRQDIESVVTACHPQGVLVKVIIETSLLSEDEKVHAGKLVVDAGADFIKTSTGFSTGGATVEDVTTLRQIVGPDIGVKASGGIRSFEDAAQMVKAGASRLGASAGVQIVQQQRKGSSSFVPGSPQDY
jgi:deoxyribose-phosphate aldolase